MTASGNEFCGDGWTERYEQLRRHALGEAAPTAGWFFGLEALLQNGMAVWMRAAPTKAIEMSEVTADLATCGWLAACQRETTLVLAAMALPQIFSNQPEELNA
jgi:hypothetical protein